MAENELDIPALLDAEDMVALSVPDKLSVATYLVQYYNYFKDKAPSQPLPGRRVAPSSAKPSGELPPAPKRTKVETIGPATVPSNVSPKIPQTAAAGRPPPHPLTDEKKTLSSPSQQQKTPPTQKVYPPKPPTPAIANASPQMQNNAARETNSSKENTPEPAEQGRKVRKGRKSKFKSPPPGAVLEVAPSSPSRNSAKRGSMGMENCDACGQRVFLMERLSVEGHVFHRSCFKCFTCKCLLKPGSYEHDSKGDLFYCRPHYREAIRQSTLKRTMQQRGLLNEDEANKEPTDVKRKKDQPPSDTASAESNQSVSSPTRNITREESQKIKAALPGLLKSLAGNKQETKDSEGSSDSKESPRHKPPPALVPKTDPKVGLASKPLQNTSAPAKPEPPKMAAESPKMKLTESPKVPSEPPKRPGEPTKRPGEPPKRPGEPTKSIRTGEPPKRPTESPKLPTEPPRRPTWSPKVTPADIAKAKGEPPKSTVLWLTKGKAMEQHTVQTSPKAPRHATVSGIPAKPSPPITSRRVEPKKEVPRSILEEKIPTKQTPSPDGSPVPVKPPRRKKHTENTHPPLTVETKTEEVDKSPTTGKQESIVPKRPAPPRPNHPPSLRVKSRPPASGK